MRSAGGRKFFPDLDELVVDPVRHAGGLHIAAVDVVLVRVDVNVQHREKIRVVLQVLDIAVVRVPVAVDDHEGHGFYFARRTNDPDYPARPCIPCLNRLRTEDSIEPPVYFGRR